MITEICEELTDYLEETKIKSIYIQIMSID
jgi:hypothetical protein